MLTRDYEAPDRLPYSSYLHAEAVSHAPYVAPAELAPNFNGVLEASSLLSALVEALPKGLIVLSTDRAIVYWNQNARRLCQKLSSKQHCWTLLPTVVADLCEQVVDGATREPMLLDYQTPEHGSFRLTASWLIGGTNDQVNPVNHQTYILITVEDRDEVLQQEIQVEQKKFHLTNREAEVWLLLRQEYSYQAIAKKLHISLNTVKTHVRNIHVKRHPYQSLPA